jgi:hypothetical protein
MTDDMIAQTNTQLLAHRTKSKPMENSYAWKSVAVENCGFFIKRLSTAGIFKSISSLRQLAGTITNVKKRS